MAFEDARTGVARPMTLGWLKKFSISETVEFGTFCKYDRIQRDGSGGGGQLAYKSSIRANEHVLRAIGLL